MDRDATMIRCHLVLGILFPVSDEAPHAVGGGGLGILLSRDDVAGLSQFRRCTRLAADAPSHLGQGQLGDSALRVVD